jgi:hypothetical protein
MKDALISGTLTLIPSYGAVWLAMQNSPRFVKATNWQSRTALVIMPALFMFGWTAESKVNYKMHEVAQETEHAIASAAWAEEKHALDRKKREAITTDAKQTMIDTERELTELYRQSVEQSGVRVVPGDRLGPHHVALNYWQENPFKILAGIGIPAVGYIFYGRSGQQHLQFQQKVMHTRVYGQFSVILGLLALMAGKEYMDRNGKFITESEANVRVAEMHRVREDLMLRLNHAKQLKEAQQHELEVAHEKDVKEGHVHDHHKKKAKQATPIKEMETMTA